MENPYSVSVSYPKLIVASALKALEKFQSSSSVDDVIEMLYQMVPSNREQDSVALRCKVLNDLEHGVTFGMYIHEGGRFRLSNERERDLSEDASESESALSVSSASSQQSIEDCGPEKRSRLC